MLFSEFVSVLIPTTYSAEIVRLIKLSNCGLTIKQSSLAIIIDRVFGLLFLAAMTSIVFFLSDTVLKVGNIVDLELTSTIFALIIFVVVILIAVIYYLQERLLKYFNIFISLFDMKDFLSLSITSLLIYVSAISSYYYAFVASGAEAAAVDVIFIVFLSFIARLVPFSVLGFSAGELVLVIVAGYFGITHEQALVTVMIIILGKYFFSLFGFLLELYCDGIDVVRRTLSRVK